MSRQWVEHEVCVRGGIDLGGLLTNEDGDVLIAMITSAKVPGYFSLPGGFWEHIPWVFPACAPISRRR